MMLKELVRFSAVVWFPSVPPKKNSTYSGFKTTTKELVRFFACGFRLWVPLIKELHLLRAVNK